MKQASPQDPPAVRLVFSGNEVTPIGQNAQEHLEGLRASLRATRELEFVPGPQPRPVSRPWDPEFLSWQAEEHPSAWPAPAVHLLQRRLSDQGVSVCLEPREGIASADARGLDRLLYRSGPWRRSRIKALEPLAQCLAEDPLGSGMIEHLNPSDRDEKVALILASYRSVKATLVVRSNAEARRMRAKLQELLKQPVRFHPRHAPSQRDRFWITTPGHLKWAEPDRLQLLVLLEVQRWADRDLSLLWRALGEASRAGVASRVYGLSPVDRLESATQRLRRQLACGDVRDSPQRPVEVLRVRTAPSEPQARRPGQSRLSHKRQTLWHHPEHNHRVAEVARAVSDPTALRRLLQPGGGTTLPMPGSIQRCRILVESREHAHRLRRLLPEGWSTHGWSDEPSEAWGALVTHAHVARWGLQADLVIRADAGEGDLHALGIPPKTNEATDKPLWVVCLDPRAHPGTAVGFT